MSNFDAREYIKRKYSGKATEELVGINANAKQKYVTEKYRKQAEKELGFDTLEADLDSLGKTITSMYDGWQTEETMKNTRSSIETMYNRLLSYQDYRKKYGITEGEDGINKLVDAYKTTLNDWDKRTALYGDYKSADEFIAAQKNAEKQQARTKEFEGSDLNGLDNKLKITEGLLKQAKEYQAEMNAVNKASGSLLPNIGIDPPTISKNNGSLGVLQNNGSLKIQQGPNLPSGLEELKEYYLGQATGGVTGPPTEKAYKDALDKFNEVIAPKSNATHITPADAAQEKLNGLLDQFGFSSVDDLESYYNALDEYRNKYVLEHGVTDLYQDYMDDSDFSKHSQYYDGHKYSFDNAESAKSHAKKLENSLVVYDKGSKKYIVYANPIYEYINNTNNARELIDGAVYYGDAKTGTMLKRGGLHKLNSEEVQLFNYLDWLDAQNDTNLASEYLDGMEEAITKRVYDEQTQRWEDFVDSSWLGATAASIASIPASMVAPLGTIAEGMLAIAEGREYNPHSQVNTFGNFASDTRKYTGENIAEATEGFELFGQNVPSFAYQTGMSMGDTMLGSMVYGKWYSLAAGTNSFQQKAKEMKEAGADYETMMSSAFASGAAEMVFEYISLDKLMKIDSIDSGAAIFKSALKQAGVEASEEFATELANIISDDVIRGSNSEINQFIRDLRNRGYSESEIKTELAKKVGGQLGWAAAGGFLSGGVMGGGQATISYSGNVASGKTIKSNERTGDMLNLASLTPQESAAYEAYSKYTGKGINADNITNAQLGNLYSLTDTDARGTLASKKSTLKQKRDATETLKKLSALDEKKTLSRDIINQYDRSIGVREAYMSSVDGLIAEGLESGKDTDSYKLASEYKQKVANGIELTEKEIEDLVKANDAAIFAEDIATLSEEDAALFKSVYDGKTDKGDFFNSFDLVKTLAENNYSADYILQHKGVLTEKQVSAIYKSKVLDSDASLEKAIKALKEKHKQKGFIEGTFNDSVINYDNSNVEGKVKWNSLNSNQKKGIVVLGQVGRRAGMDIELIADGLEKGINGAFEIRGNKMLIDIYAGLDKIDGSKLQDTIIPTASHEMTHWMESKSPELYRKYDKYVFETLTMSGKSESEILAARRKKMEAAHPDATYTDAEVRSEVIARASEDMFANSNEIKKFLNTLTDSEKKSFVNKVKEILQNIKEWLNDFLSKQKSNSDEAKLIREFKNRIDEQIKLWDAMLKSSIEANQALQNEGITGEQLANAQKNTTNKGDVQNADIEFNEYSVQAALWEAFDHQDMGNDNLIKVSNMPQYIVDKFGIEGDFYIYRDHAYENMVSEEQAIEDDRPTKRNGKKINFHNLGIETMTKAILSINEPNITIADKMAEGNPAVTMVLPVFDVNNQPLYGVISFYSNKSINGVFTKKPHILLTIYGKDYFEENGKGRQGLTDIVTNAIEEKRVVDFNRKKIREDLPVIAQHTRLSNIAETSLKESLSQFRKEINAFREKNKIQYSDRDTLGNILSEEQKSYFAESKMRDDDGNLMVMYQGSQEEFFEFDRKKSSPSNLYGRGFYFTTSKAHAKQYGDVREFYLNIKKPLSLAQNSITKAQMLNFLKAIENDGEDYDLYNYGEGATAESVLNSVWGKGDFEMLQDVSASAIGDLVAAVELFNKVNGTSYDGIVLPTETVVFNSEQAKLTTNKLPTDNKDMRFSMRDNVEETKDLVAVHNLSEEKLLKSLRLGGLPMPSIAIARAKEGHSSFGKISLVFNKDTIDPQNNKRNKVYSGDAWTPTYPRVEYKVSVDAAEKVSDKIDELLAGTDYKTSFGYFYLDTDSIQDYLNRNGGDIYDAIGRKEALKLAFLKDSGIELDLPSEEKQFTHRFDNEVIVEFANKYGKDAIIEMLNYDNTAMVDRHIPEIKEIVEKHYSEQVGKKMNWAIDRDDVYAVIDGANKYFRNGIVKKTDTYAARDIINSAVDETEYKSWLNNLFADIVEKEGIRNNADIFTRSGNRRSFEALHYEHNLENVIKAMMESGEKGIGTFGGGNIFGAATTEYDSISEIKEAAQNRLGNMSQEEYDKIKEDFSHRFFELAYSLPLHKDSYTATDDAANMLIEAVSKFKTKSGMANYIRRESQGWAEYSDYVVDDLIELVRDIRNMPVGYFEAKPQRAVGFDEVAAAILPDDANAELKTKLTENGVKVVEYESGNEESRLKALNSLEDVKFSDRDSDGHKLSKEQVDFFKDSKIRDEKGRLLAVYHGTKSAGFTRFTKTDEIGYFFARSLKTAQTYSNNSKVVYTPDRYTDTDVPNEANYQVYLNIKKPYIIDGKGANWNGLESTGEKVHLSIKTSYWGDDGKGLGKIVFKYGGKTYSKIVHNVNEFDLFISQHTNPQLAYACAAEMNTIADKNGKGKFEVDLIWDFKKRGNADSKNTRDIVRRAYESHWDYDGVIFKNVVDSGNGTKIKADDLYVAFNSNQIKSTANTEPTSDPDIRYSERDNVSVYDLMGENSKLAKDNEQLKEDVERLKERLKLERQITHGNFFNENQLNTVAGHIRNIADSNFEKKELVHFLNSIYQYIAHSEDLNWDDLYSQCYDLADLVLDKSREVTEVNPYFKDILTDIRKTKISANEQQIQNARYRMGEKWRNAFFNRVTITNDGISLDRQWQEWAAQYPDIFDAEISDADMLTELYDIYDSVKQASETVVEYDKEERTRWLAREIYNQYWNVSPIRTTADRYDKQIKRLNFEHRKAMQEMRDRYNEEKNQHKADKRKARELIKAVRDRKDREIAEVKKKSKERMDAYKENAERKTKIQSITANALTLNKWLTANSKDYHINETLKPVVINLLQAIDFSSKQMLDKGIPTKKDISLYKALQDVKDMLVNANNETALSDLTEMYGIDLDEEITDLLKASFATLTSLGDNGYILNEMNLANLKTLDKVVKTIKQVVSKLNKFHVANHYKGVANLSQNSIAYFNKLGKTKTYDPKSAMGKLTKLLNWNNLNPFYAFKKFGEGGEVMFEAMQDAQDKFAFHIKAIIDFAEKAYTNKEVREWCKDVKTVKVHDMITNKDVEVQITVAQAMSLYCSLKREQAKGHILGDGIRITDISVKKGEVISQADGVKLSENDIGAIVGLLTKRQMEVADKLQEFMNTVCTDWGNEISMARFGYNAFGEPNYFPISSDKNNLAVDDAQEKINSLFRLLNMSFTKSVKEGASNTVEIKDIFDVFAQHASDMAKYNAFALPILDFYKWYNYTEKGYVDGQKRTTASLKASLEKAFGKDAQEYITTFLKDINGQYDVSRDALGKGFFKNAKIAAVGFNLRVALLQPTSYVRASAVIDNKYLTKALLHKPKMGKAMEWCGMALWKSLGYYDTNIQRGLTDLIKHDEDWKDKAVEVSMKGAEVADKITWGYLWNACELEIRDTRKDLQVGGKEFYETIGKRLREVIYATQVVDSVMTRSQMMRSPSFYDKMLTAFASETTLSYNMLYDALETAHLEKRETGKISGASGKKIARVMIAYTLTNALAALVESGFDAFRDEDDEEMDIAEFMKLYLTNFAYDMSITAKLPYIKEAVSIMQGFTSSRTDTQWMQSLGYALRGWYKVITGEGTPESAIKNSLRSLSYLSGLPFYNAYRDLIAALDKFGILSTEELEEFFEDLF